MELFTDIQWFYWDKGDLSDGHVLATDKTVFVIKPTYGCQPDPRYSGEVLTANAGD